MIAARASFLTVNTGIGQFNPLTWSDAVVRTKLSPGAKITALVLAQNFARKTDPTRGLIAGRCKRRMDTLADQLGRSVRTVRRYLTELTKAGLLVRWQNSRHKCNRVQALLPARLDRPRDPNVGVAQLCLSEEPPPPADSAAKDLGAPTPQVSPVGGHLNDCPPEEVIITRRVRLGAGVIAPCGFSARPRQASEPTPQGEQARATLRASGVSEVAIGYLALVCKAQEMHWISSELVMGGEKVRNATRYVAKLFNDLVEGQQHDKRKKTAPKPRAVGFYAENVKAPETAPPAAIPPLEAPKLAAWSDGWRAAWSELGNGVRWRAERDYAAAGLALVGQYRRAWLSKWLVENYDLELGQCPIEEVDAPMRRARLVEHERVRLAHRAEYPALYPEPDAAPVGFVIPAHLAADEDISALEAESYATLDDAAEKEDARAAALAALRSWRLG